MSKRMLGKADAWIVFFATILIGISFEKLNLLPINSTLKNVLEMFWNVTLCSIVGYIFLKNRFLNQFKHFSFKKIAWGLPLTILVGIAFSLFFSTIFGKPTENSVGNVITLQMVLIR